MAIIPRTLYSGLIREVAGQYSLDPDLVEAIVIRESRGGQADAFRFEQNYYHAYVKNHPTHQHLIPRRAASSYGLMQVMYPTAYDLGFRGEPEELFVPKTSLRFGCMYLKSLLDWSNGNVEQAVAAYNGGKGNWDRPRAQAYRAAVMLTYQDLREGK